MSYNLNRFNLTSFNNKDSKVINIITAGEENVVASIGSASNTSLLAIGFERVENQLVGAPVRFIKKRAGSETVDAVIPNAQTVVFVVGNYTETISGGAHALADISLQVTGTETIIPGSEVTKEMIHAGAKYSIIVTGSEAVTPASETVKDRISAGAKVFTSAEGYELVSESASLIVLDTLTCYLNVTLRPGDVLIIDAETYNVLKNGQNAIDIQSGDWIDELNRNTTDITITAASGAGNLTATAVYTERYL